MVLFEKVFIHENEYENVVWKIETILSELQFVNPMTFLAEASVFPSVSVRKYVSPLFCFARSHNHLRRLFGTMSNPLGITHFVTFQNCLKMIRQNTFGMPIIHVPSKLELFVSMSDHKTCAFCDLSELYRKWGRYHYIVNLNWPVEPRNNHFFCMICMILN